MIKAINKVYFSFALIVITTHYYARLKGKIDYKFTQEDFFAQHDMSKKERLDLLKKGSEQHKNYALVNAAMTSVIAIATRENVASKIDSWVEKHTMLPKTYSSQKKTLLLIGAITLGNVLCHYNTSKKFKAQENRMRKFETEENPYEKEEFENLRHAYTPTIDTIVLTIRSDPEFKEIIKNNTMSNTETLFGYIIIKPLGVLGRFLTRWIIS